MIVNTVVSEISQQAQSQCVSVSNSKININVMSVKRSHGEGSLGSTSGHGSYSTEVFLSASASGVLGLLFIIFCLLLCFLQ